jgi:hypothetical protein
MKAKTKGLPWAQDAEGWWRRQTPSGALDSSRFTTIPDYRNGCSHSHQHRTDTGIVQCSWCFAVLG